MRRIKILAVVGSLRKDSYNRQLALAAKEILGDRVDFELLKNLLDWLSRPADDDQPHVLEGKPAAISGVSPAMTGTSMAQDHLVTLISFLNMDVMNKPRFTIPNVMQQLDSDDRLKLESSRPFLVRQANEFADFIERRMKCNGR